MPINRRSRILIARAKLPPFGRFNRPAATSVLHLKAAMSLTGTDGSLRSLLLVFATLDTQHETANPLNRTAVWCMGRELYNGSPLSQIMNKELDKVVRHRPALPKPFPIAGCLDRRRWGTGSRSLRLAIWTLFDGMLYHTACNFVQLRHHTFLAPTLIRLFEVSS